MVGELTPRRNKDITLTETSTALPKIRGDQAGFNAEGKLNRGFLMVWSKTLDGGGLVVGDEVLIKLDIEASRRSPNTHLMPSRPLAMMSCSRGICRPLITMRAMVLGNIGDVAANPLVVQTFWPRNPDPRGSR